MLGEHCFLGVLFYSIVRGSLVIHRWDRMDRFGLC
jgi:hypothetical protein